MTCDFDLWQDAVPVVSINGSPEFNLWVDDVPLCDVGVALGEEPETGRRRVMIF